MKIPDDLTLVIFGASGDLTLRKLIPALLELSKQTMLPKNFSVLGVGRTAMTDDQFQVKMKEGLRLFARENSDSVLNTCDFCNTLHYQQIDTKSATDYEVLAKRIVELNQSGNVLFYLATPPSMYGVITANLKAVNLTTEKAGWRRIIIEKPFGYDLESAIALNAELLENIREHQIYRIDHYLGKETVQNILVTRFGNAIYEPLWNRNYISHIEVTSCENIGVENRGGYYDGSGALRDMLQNHLLQLVGMIAMEPPANADDQSIRNEMLKVFQSFRPLTEDKLKSSVVLGQYTENHDKSGYRNEAGVDPESRTETFVALKFFIDNWRWRGVPFFIRTGKRLPTRVTEIVIHFQDTPHRIFQKKVETQKTDNQLIIRIQPDEGILMKFNMKIPGAGFVAEPVNMGFSYGDLQHNYMPSSYERLLHDCMIGDATLYQRGDAVEETWRFVDPIIKACQNEELSLHGYPAGSWGPNEADFLMASEGKTWHYPCKNLANDGLYCEL